MEGKQRASNAAGSHPGESAAQGWSRPAPGGEFALAKLVREIEEEPHRADDGVHISPDLSAHRRTDGESVQVAADGRARLRRQADAQEIQVAGDAGVLLQLVADGSHILAALQRAFGVYD